MTRYLVETIRVQDYKRLRDITLNIEADVTFVLIGGKNAQGKTSLLDTMRVALGGKPEVEADPVRHGADIAIVDTVILGDDGTRYEIKRIMSPDGSSSLEVRDDMGAIKSPQAFLDRIVGKRFLDPLAFLALKPKDQRQRLLDLLDKDGAIAAMDDRYDRVFKRRTEVNRDLDKAKATLSKIPEVTPVEEVDVSALVDAHNAVTAEHQELGARLARINARQVTVDRGEERLARARKMLDEAHAELNAAHGVLDVARIALADQRTTDALPEDVNTHDQATEILARKADLQRQIRESADHNRAAAAAAAEIKRRAEMLAEIVRLDGGLVTLESELETIKAAKADALINASLPVTDLSVSADAVLYQGVPLGQASGAEKHRVAIALAIAAQSELRDVCIRDGALLDEESLEAMRELAERSEVRLWVERVGTKDAGVIVVHDGKIVA